jgi:K+/H+ antiporter YhaU regulatory subunit KhtT
LPRAQLSDVRALSELKIESVLVRPSSAADGASPAQMKLRSTTGVLVVGVQRREELLQSPDPEAVFEPGDIVYFVGTSSAIRQAVPLFDA